MNNYDYEIINDNISRVIGDFSKKTSKITEGLSVIASSKALLALTELFNSIPDDIKKTCFFEKVQRLNKTNLCYEEVIWIIDDYGYTFGYNDWKTIAEFSKSKL